MLSPYRARTLWHTLWGVATTIALHAALAATVVVLVLCDLLTFTLPGPLLPTLQVQAARPSEPLVLYHAPALASASDVVTVDAAELAAKLSDPRWQALVEPADSLPQRDSAGILLHQELLRIADDTQRHSLDENLERLEDLSQKLTSVSSEQGVSEVSTQINKLLGTSTRAEKPVEGAQGEFDFATAQMHDVKRERAADGKWKYAAVLLDANGRTFESPLGAEEGESTYRTMQLIKSNPLLERVYRGVVMQVLDKVMKSQ